MRAARRRTSPSLRCLIITGLMITVLFCCFLAGAAAGNEGTVQVSARIAPTIQVAEDGTVRSNTTVKTQVVDGVLTIMHL